MTTKTNYANPFLAGGSYEAPAAKIVELEIEGALCNNASMRDSDHEDWYEEDLW